MTTDSTAPGAGTQGAAETQGSPASVGEGTGTVKPSAWPEHDKLHRIREFSQTCGEFIEWLSQAKGIYLAEYREFTEERSVDWYDPTKGTYLHTSRDLMLTGGDNLLSEWLAGFFGIDRDALEQEKRQMLAEIRAAAEGEEAGTVKGADLVMTGVFATSEEAAELRSLADDASWLPFVLIAGNCAAADAHKRVLERVHECALSHGLPEIEGYYGLTAEGEFCKAPEGDAE